MIHRPGFSVRQTLAVASNCTFPNAPPVRFLSANVCIHLRSDFFFSATFTAIVTF